MTCQESEALGLLLQQHLTQIAVSQTYLAVICDRTGDAEGLQSLADSGCCVRRSAASLLNGDRRTYRVRPAGILETDRLDLLFT